MMKETPKIMIMMCAKYCLNDKWAEAILLLKKVARKLNNTEMLVKLNKINPIIFYGGNIIPYIPMELTHINIVCDGDYDNVETENILRNHTEAKGTVYEVLYSLMEEVGIDMPTFTRNMESMS